MSKLADIAKKSLGTQSLKISEIIEQFGGVVTVNELGYADYKGDRVPVFGFAEGDGASFWGGCKKLRELAIGLEEAYGDLREVNAALALEGVRIKICPTTRTKAGNVFRPIIMLGTVKFDDVRDTVKADPDTGEVNSDDEPF